MRSYAKISVKSLRSLGFDERWLQQRIVEDPAILGLGEVTVVERERQMIGGGRLDLLLADRESETRYEVELMLGALDESHIIRTIEYWDVERRRFPSLNHCAVIVAEDITSRFLNVISLLNKCVPLIALQMSALDLEDKIGLTFVRVLDLTETFDEIDGEEEPQIQVSRAQWDTDGYRESLKVVDMVADALKDQCVQARVTYTNQYIAIGSTGPNFVWCHPRKSGGLCRLEFRVGAEAMEQWVARLSQSELGEVTHGRRYVKFSVTAAAFEKRRVVICELITFCEDQARR